MFRTQRRAQSTALNDITEGTMTIRRQITKVLECGLTAAILIAGVFVSSSANASNRPVDPPLDDEPIADTVLCSASDSRSPTGRQYAILRPSSRDPSFCLRFKLGGVADNAIPDCWKVARAAVLDCREIVDVN